MLTLFFRIFLDFSENIYDKKLHIEFLSFIREEQKFNTVEALSKQVYADINNAKKYLIKKGLL